MYFQPKGQRGAKARGERSEGRGVPVAYYISVSLRK